MCSQNDDPSQHASDDTLRTARRDAASATDEGPWKEDARRYAQNADYWRDLYETAAATIERLSARPSVPALDVPEDRRVPIEPETPEAMLLIQVGAMTVKDDSGETCTLILGDVNSVGRRLAALRSKEPTDDR